MMGLEITEHRKHDVVVPDNRVIRTEHLFGVRTGGLWLVTHNGDINFRDRADAILEQQDVEGVLDELKRRQQSCVSSGRAAIHDGIVKFLSVNWDRLCTVLTGLPTETSLPSFREVDIGTNLDGFSKGRVDFMGLSPDKRMFTFEVGGRSKGKQVQVGRHLRGLREFIPYTVPIIPIVAKYSSINGAQVVELRSGPKYES